MVRIEIDPPGQLAGEVLTEAVPVARTLPTQFLLECLSNLRVLAIQCDGQLVRAYEGWPEMVTWNPFGDGCQHFTDVLLNVVRRPYGHDDNIARRAPSRCSGIRRSGRGAACWKSAYSTSAGSTS